ncbi:MAG: PH domain-containing protein [Reyranella sp.]|jgi:hypothetical protein|nr:PH domain-containing protein [Reyranella sp.]
MAPAKSVEARYSALHNLGMAAIAVAMIVGAIIHFATNSQHAPTFSLNDPRFVLFSVIALAMAYYIFLGVSRYVDRRPQIVIDRDGIVLGFGRNRRLAWDDIEWVRLRRLALRPQLQIGVRPETFVAADLRLSLFNLDDSLRPIRGVPAAVLVRDNGLDVTSSAMLDAVGKFRPNLVKS